LEVNSRRSIPAASRLAARVFCQGAAPTANVTVTLSRSMANILIRDLDFDSDNSFHAVFLAI
jgi:hypothetical protein